MAPLTAGGAQLTREALEEYIEYPVKRLAGRGGAARHRGERRASCRRPASLTTRWALGCWPGGRASLVGLRLTFPRPQLWHELCDLISQNPDKVQSLNVDAIIRGASPASPTSWASSGAHWPTTTSVAVTSRRCLAGRGLGAGRDSSSTLCLWGHCGRRHTEVEKHVPVYLVNTF